MDRLDLLFVGLQTSFSAPGSRLSKANSKQKRYSLMETIEKETGIAEEFTPAHEEADVREIDDSDVEYPESDGEPMGETGYHVRASMHLLQALSLFFNGRDDVYVAADMFLYYEKGNPAACKAPDVMVIKGVANQERRTFKTWEENAAPCLIFEITSQSSMIDDLLVKSQLYAKLGVREYFVFDPLHEYLKLPFTGFRLKNGVYSPIPAGEDGSVYSVELKTTLKRDDDLLRIVDPETGKYVPSIKEAVRMARKEAERAEQESKRADMLAAKLREMGVDPDSLSVS